MTLLLAVNDFPPILGGEATLYHGVAACLPRGSAVILAPRGPGQAAIDAALEVDVVRHRIPAARTQASRVLRGVLAGAAMLRLVARRRVRFLVCGQLLSIGVPGRIVARLSGIRYALVIHGADLADYHDRFPWGRLIRWTVRGAEVVFVNSRFTAGLVEQLLPGSARRLEVLPMGTAPARPVPVRILDAWRGRYGIGNGPVLITVARLVGVKGHEVMLAALDRIRHRRPDIVWLVVGDGPDRSRIEARIGELELQRHVRLVGEVAAGDLPAHYRLGTLFVQISRDPGRRRGVEGFGLSFLEAAAYGLPVVAGRSGGTPEAVVDRETGILVHPGDPAGIAEAIERLLADPEGLRRMGEAGRRWAAAHTWEGAAGALLAAAGIGPADRSRDAALAPWAAAGRP